MSPLQNPIPKQFLRDQSITPIYKEHRKTKCEEVYYFCRTTVTHGFAHIVDKEETCCLRILWACVISALVILAVWIVVLSIQSLTDGSLTSEFVEKDNSDSKMEGMILPDIHICDASIFKASSLAEMGFDNTTATYLTLATMPEVGNKNTSTDKRDLQTLKNEFDGILAKKSLTMAEILNQASLKCTDIIWACSKTGVFYNFTECCDIFFNSQTYVTTFGSCISTHGKKITQKYESRAAGFVVYAKPNLDNVIDFDESLIKVEFILQKGIYYAVSSATVDILQILQSEGRYAMPNAWTSLPISKKVINSSELKRMDNLSGIKCVDTWNDDYRKKACPEYDYYSQSNCEETRYKKNLFNLSNCVVLFLKHEDSYPLCDPHTILALKFPAADKNASSCPIECEKELFQLSPSSAQYSEHYFNRTRILDYPIYEPTVLHFFYPSFKYQVLINHIKTPDKAFGEIGGALGLILGFSIISVLEIFALLIRCCFKSRTKSL